MRIPVAKLLSLYLFENPVHPPWWFLVIILCSSRNESSSDLRISSVAFSTFEFAIGLNEAGSVFFLPGFSRGVKCAIFRAFGEFISSDYGIE